MYSMSVKKTKDCSVCGKSQPVSNFTVNKALKSGLSSFCKSCASERRKQYYNKDKEHINKLKKKNRKKYRDKELAYNKEYYKKTQERRLEYARQYRRDNRDKLLADIREYNKTHKKENKERTQKYRKNNPEKIRKIKAEYRKNNPEAVQKHHMTRRARKAQNGVFEVSKKELHKLMNSPCVACGSTGRITIDHIIPIARGGAHSIGNLQPLCKSCNSSKVDKTMTEWKNS